MSRPSTAWRAFSEVARAELRGTGIHVTTVYMGPVTDTELSLGMRPRRLVRFSTPQQVAAAIVNATCKSRPEVWVPASLGPVVKAVSLLPRRLRRQVLAALGVMAIATDVDRSARSAYEDRVLAEAAKTAR